MPALAFFFYRFSIVDRFLIFVFFSIIETKRHPRMEIDGSTRGDSINAAPSRRRSIAIPVLVLFLFFPFFFYLITIRMGAASSDGKRSIRWVPQIGFLEKQNKTKQNKTNKQSPISISLDGISPGFTEFFISRLRPWFQPLGYGFT